MPAHPFFFGPRRRRAPRRRLRRAAPRFREFTKGGLVKGGLATYVLFNHIIAKPPFTKPPFVNSRVWPNRQSLGWRHFRLLLDELELSVLVTQH